MPVQLILPARSIPLDPGEPSSCEVRVHNTGLTADRFTFEVIGSAASWCMLDPPTVELGPDAATTVLVHFRPPRSAHVRAGRIPFGLLTTSTRERTSSVVEQLLELARFCDTSVELVACSARRRFARYRLIVSNQGNATVHARVRGRDLDDTLWIGCSPAELTVFPGLTAHCQVQVRPRQRLRPCDAAVSAFQILVQPDMDSPLMAIGSFQHQSGLFR